MKPLSELTNDEFNDFVVNQMLEGWIPLKMYLRLFPTETQSAIDVRVSRKFWQRGVHYSSPPGGGAWVCLTAIREWAKGQQTEEVIRESLPHEKAPVGRL